jgi:hypothetical protein
MIIRIYDQKKKKKKKKKDLYDQRIRIPQFFFFFVTSKIYFNS